jgi:hypothetical protein
LTKAVHAIGTRDWDAVADRMNGRNARQCHDRWDNYLSPSVFTGPWTSQDKQTLTRLVAQYGSAWKRIAGFFPSRSDVNVKSHWRQMQRRMRKCALADATQMRIPQTGPLLASRRVPFIVPLLRKPTPAPNDQPPFQFVFIHYDREFESWF